MKKVILYILIIIALTFLFPVILTSKITPAVDTIAGTTNGVLNQVENKEIDKTAYDYSKYGTINVLNTQNNEVKQMNLDEYLLGVVSAEMPATYNIEALKAQAVVARTYTIYTIMHNVSKHGEGTICTSSTCCQAWISKEDRMNKWDDNEKESNWSKIEEAVYSTKGQVIEYNGEVIDAFFHSNSGGKTELPANVWGGYNYPYLKSVETAGEDNYSQYSSEVCITKKELLNKMKQAYPDFTIDWSAEDCIKITERTDGQRARFVKIGNKTISGVQVRSIFGLKSANFEININEENVSFSVIGYGHGVGMSQTGADSMAKAGASYIDIIKHFYSDVEIINM